MAVPIIGVSRNLLGVALAAAGLVLGAYFIGNGLKRKPAGEYINVTGMAEIDFTSDLIVWNANFNRTGDDLKQVYQSITSDQQKVKNFLSARGVNDSEIVFGTASVDKQFEYRNENGVSRSYFTGYKVSQTVTVKSKKVDEIAKISRESMALIEQGLEFNSQNPEYYFTHLSDLKISLIEKATKDARLRAEKMAQAAGSELGKLKKSTLGVFQITGQYQNEDFSWGGVFNTSNKLKTARVTVTAGFGAK
jgi:hypothetical protein